jgi:hypothetical protein
MTCFRLGFLVFKFQEKDRKKAIKKLEKERLRKIEEAKRQAEEFLDAQ